MQQNDGIAEATSPTDHEDVDGRDPRPPEETPEERSANIRRLLNRLDDDTPLPPHTRLCKKDRKLWNRRTKATRERVKLEEALEKAQEREDVLLEKTSHIDLYSLPPMRPLQKKAIANATPGGSK